MMEQTIVYLTITAMLVYWCNRIAVKNGRDGIWAIFWGILGGIFAVIIYAIVGATKEVEIKRAEKLVCDNGESKIKKFVNKL